eukprot:12108784-Ditylum_brightwellii.AAC.1
MKRRSIEKKSVQQRLTINPSPEVQPNRETSEGGECSTTVSHIDTSGSSESGDSIPSTKPYKFKRKSNSLDEEDVTVGSQLDSR